MLSEAQIARVWKGMLEGEMRALYFGELVEKYQSKQRWATIVAMVASSAAFASFVIGSIPAEARPILTLFASIVSAYSLVAQNSRRAIDASDLHLRWGRIAMDYQMIWENVYADDAADRLRPIADRELDASKASTSFPNDVKALTRWQNHVERQHLAHV
jgi:hypothetical protein